MKWREIKHTEMKQNKSERKFRWRVIFYIPIIANVTVNVDVHRQLR